MEISSNLRGHNRHMAQEGLYIYVLHNMQMETDGFQQRFYGIC